MEGITPVSRIEHYLDQIEQNTSSGGGGGGGGSDSSVLVVHDVDGTLDKTWQEIRDMVTSGKIVCILNVEDDGLFVFPCFLTMVYGDDVDDRYAVEFSYVDQTVLIFSFATDTPDGYPVFED